MTRTTIRYLTLALLVTLAGGTVVPISAATACASDQSIDSFDVVAEARRDVYRIGETALVDVWVTDKVTGAPQQDVDAGVVVEGRGDRAVFDVSKTDEEGHALLRLRLKRSDVSPGWARSFAGAWDPINTPVYCTGRHGYREYPKLFRVQP